MKEPQKFILLATPRTGSTVMVELLNQNSEIRCYNEMFVRLKSGERKGKKFFAGPSDFPIFNESNEKSLYPRDEASFYYLKKILEQEVDGVGAIGLKLMYHDVVNEVGLLSYLIKTKPKVIHLIRKNYLRCLVSLVRAGKTNVFQTKEEVVEKTKVTLNTKILIDELGAMKNSVIQMQAALIKDGFESLNVYYEDLFSDSGCFFKIFNFLGVQNQIISFDTQLKKIGGTDLKDEIDNFDEVKLVLQGTEFFSMLDS